MTSKLIAVGLSACFMVVSASLFIRAGIFLSFVLNHGPFGFNPATLAGPFLTFMSFAQYLVPLAVLEIYLRTQDRAGAARTLRDGRRPFRADRCVGRRHRRGHHGRVPAQHQESLRQPQVHRRNTLCDHRHQRHRPGGKQYHELKAAATATYNLDEDELNTLGYQLIRAKKFEQAIRIFQLNVEAYPHSGNTYDSLAEAYMDDGNKSLAIANYQRSLQLNPQNSNAVKMLQKLNAP